MDSMNEEEKSRRKTELRMLANHGKLIATIAVLFAWVFLTRPLFDREGPLGYRLFLVLFLLIAGIVAVRVVIDSLVGKKIAELEMGARPETGGAPDVTPEPLTPDETAEPPIPDDIRERLKTETLWKCPHCGTPNPASQETCWKCGKSMRA